MRPSLTGGLGNNGSTSVGVILYKSIFPSPSYHKCGSAIAAAESVIGLGEC